MSERAVDLISQSELESLHSLKLAYTEGLQNIEERLASGAWIVPGTLSFDAGEVVPTSARRRLDRLRNIARLLSRDDYEFLSGHPAVQRKFMEARSRLLSLELRTIWADSKRTLRSRMQRVRLARRWGAYLSVLTEIARAYLSILKLRLAARLLRCELWGFVDVERNIQVLIKSLSPEMPCELPRS